LKFDNLLGLRIIVGLISSLFWRLLVGIEVETFVSFHLLIKVLFSLANLLQLLILRFNSSVSLLNLKLECLQGLLETFLGFK